MTVIDRHDLYILSSALYREEQHALGNSLTFNLLSIRRLRARVQAELYPAGHTPDCADQPKPL